MNNITDEVRFFLSNNNLTDSKTCPVLVAFSGGYDSTCLLHVMHSIGFENIIAIHLNHNWRGEESYNEMLKCEKFCKTSGIQFYSETLSEEIPKTETAAREARYDFFKRCAKKFGSNAVLTAHNSDDNAETLIYRIAKGTGLDGLGGIYPVREIFYRPLLKVSRDEIEQYCARNNLEPNSDSSNKNIKYKRNLIRHKIIPILKEINPDVLGAVNSLAELAFENSEYFDSVISSVGNNTENFIRAHRVIQTRIIKQMLVNHAIDYDKEKIEHILKFIIENSGEKSGKTYSLSNNLFIYVNHKYFEVIQKTAENKEQIEIKSPGKYILSDYIFTLEECGQCPEKFPPDSEKTAYVLLGDIDFTLRTRKDRDIIFPLGASGKQKLKKYLNEKKIPSYIKDKMIFLCKDKEVLWAPGLGISEKIKTVGKNVSHLLKLRRREE